MKQIVLASQSPRRKELLEKCGYAFITEPADIDETIREDQDLCREIQRLSKRKAEHILEKHPDCIVIGSDTIVVVDNCVLGKPKDHADAQNMLRMLSGRAHQVITGICIMSSQRVYTNAVSSDVHFASLSDQEILDYIATGECDDKAGAYAIQGYGSKFIKGIEGDYYSIMGFPLHLVYEELKNIDLY